MERNGLVLLQQRDQLRLGLRQPGVRLQLEDGQDEHARVVRHQEGLVAPDHLQESRNESGTRVELDVRGQDEEGVGRLAGDVPTDVDRIIESAERIELFTNF